MNKIDGWKIEKLGNVCDIQIGGTPSRDNPFYWDNDKNTSNLWVSIRDLETSPLISTEEHITDLGARNSNAKLVKQGTLLMSFKLTIGRVAFAGKDLFTNEAIAAITPRDKNKINRLFLYYQLPFIEPERYCDVAVKGKTLNKQKLNILEIPLPIDEHEQSKIAEVLSKIDEAIQQTEKLIEKNKLIKSGLMQDLFTKGIDEKGNIRREATHKFKDSFFRGIKIPENWTLGKMKDICKVKQGLQIAISLRHKEGGKNRYVYITIQYLSDPARYLEFIENPSESVICKKNDILFTRTGNTGQILTDIEGVFHNNFFKVIYEDKMILRDYLVYFLRQEIIQTLILDLAGTTTIPDLKHKDFYSIPIYYPENIEEQEKILKLIKEQDLIINKLRDGLSKLFRIKDGLMQDLLTGEIRVTPLMQEAITQHG